MRIVEWIRENIAEGTLRAGEKLPTEEELSVEFKCSRYTVRQAIAYLENEDLVYKIQGSGSYLSKDIEKLRNFASNSKNNVIVNTADRKNSLQERGRNLQKNANMTAGNLYPEKSFRNDKSKIIGLVMVNERTHIFPDVLRGITEYLTEKGYFLSMYVTDNDLRKERQAIEKLLELNPAGIILEPASSALVPYNNDLYERVSKEIPFITLHGSPMENILNLSLEAREGTRQLMRLLVNNGHKKIGSIYCMNEQTATYRFMGLLDVVFEKELPFERDHTIWITRNQAEKLFQPGGCLLLDEMIENVTAIVCHDDRIAELLIKYLQSKGLCVPEDISVVGYDDAEGQAAMGITTVRHPKRKYGENAARALVHLIEDPATFDITGYQIEPELIEKKTVAKAKEKN